jgi:hypothetical protein
MVRAVALRRGVVTVVEGLVAAATFAVATRPLTTPAA